jgi:hypothetical protein
LAAQCGLSSLGRATAGDEVQPTMGMSLGVAAPGRCLCPGHRRRSAESPQAKVFERVEVTGVADDSDDARLNVASGRMCLANDMRIETGKPFAIEDKDLTDCGK